MSGYRILGELRGGGVRRPVFSSEVQRAALDDLQTVFPGHALYLVLVHLERILQGADARTFGDQLAQQFGFACSFLFLFLRRRGVIAGVRWCWLADRALHAVNGAAAFEEVINGQIQVKIQRLVWAEMLFECVVVHYIWPARPSRRIDLC